jgi:hypothetical protein
MNPLVIIYHIFEIQKYLSILAAGLDPQSRKNLNKTLAQLHLARSPRIILGLRQGEQVPDWVTHILDVRDGTASARHSSNFSESHLGMKVIEEKLPTTPVLPPKHKVGDVVVDMKDVNVTYGTRKVNQLYDRSFIKKFLMVPSDLRFSRILLGK